MKFMRMFDILTGIEVFPPMTPEELEKKEFFDYMRTQVGAVVGGGVMILFAIIFLVKFINHMHLPELKRELHSTSVELKQAAYEIKREQEAERWERATKSR